MASLMFVELRKLIQAEPKRKAELLQMHGWRPDIYDEVEQARLTIDNPPEVVEALRREWDSKLEIPSIKQKMTRRV